jgi:hypothetical protein
MRGLIFTLLVPTLLAGGMSSARAGDLDRAASGDAVTVAVSSPFSKLPPGGYVPYQVTIRNDRNSAGTWHLFFQGAGNMTASGATYYEQDMTVAPNASGSFNVIVPLPAASDRGNTTLTIGVRGPGFENSNSQYFAYLYSNNGGTHPPYSVIGADVLAPVGLGTLETFYKGRGQEFYGSDVDTARLPDDWRAYSGVAAIFLKDTEWLGLTSGQRDAICDYVAQGGRLTLFTTDNVDTRSPELQLPSPDGKPGDYGFGSITVENTAAYPIDTTQLTADLERHPAKSPADIEQAFSTWGLRGRVGTITVDSGFILSFVFLFGALIGPVNLFVFARGSKRFRLFWTTPLISILASLALAIGILVTDGINGAGKQMIAVFSLPGTNREAVIQEQICRTAVLFSSRWHNEQNYLIAPVPIRAPDDDTYGTHYRRASPRADLAHSPDTFVQIGNDFSGNWFRSRAVCGQYLQAMRPSRSALTVMNPADVKSRVADPIVLSSFPQELTEVYLTDAQGNVWECANLAPGHKTTCTLSSSDALGKFWSDACVDAGGKLSPALNAASNRPDFFYAKGLPPAGDTLATLGEIHWTVVSGVYLGPWVASPNPESGP